MFEFLFKYQSDLFERGTLLLAWPWWQFVLLLLGTFMLAFVALGGHTGLVHRGIVALLRSLSIFLVMFSLLQPLLEVSTQIPQRSVVGILIDNSISMSVRDFVSEPRSQYIRDQLDPEQGSLLLSLKKGFDTRLFRFGEDTETLTDIDALDYQDGDSDLTGALQAVQGSLKGEPLAGLVVISDGAIRSTTNLNSTLLSLRAAGIPVHTIGVGQTQYKHDIEVTRVKLPKKVLQDSRVIADVSIKQQGYDNQMVELVVEDDSRILHKQRIRLKAGVQSFKVPLDAAEAGPRQLQFHIATRLDEQISENNSIHGMLSVDDSEMRILYFEGEPRFELKFVRRAVSEDRNLRVTGLVRTADAKFYSVGVKSTEELRNGFPTTRNELFSYHALILGSVENSLLSREQQELIVDFVSQRGGGLLMLGGRHAFAEGGYRTSVLQDIAPVIMENSRQREFMQQIRVQPTTAGWMHPALLIADTNKKSMARWPTLPPLTIVNPIRRIKPGATLLLTGSSHGQDNPYVALAFQRYGRGKVVAFPVQNSWLWQMHHEIDVEDQTHEIFWRQLLRWLVDSVPPRLSLTLSSGLIHANGVIKLQSEALDRSSKAHNSAQIRAVVTAPNGFEKIKALTRDPLKRGVYEAEISVADSGDYLVRVELEEEGEVTRSDETRFKVTNVGSEYHQSEMNEKLLRRISADTNGGFFTPASAGHLIEVLGKQQRGSKVLVSYELWDMPLLFLLLVLLLCTEWGYRRWRNMA